MDTPGHGDPLDDGPEEPVVLLKASRPGPARRAGGDAGEPDADAAPEDDPRYLPPHLDPFAPTVLGPLPPIERPRGWRRTLLRTFVVLLLVAAAVVVVVAASMILEETEDGPVGRKAVNGVLMPNDAAFRSVALTLLRRKTPEKITGMTVVGAEGKVTVIRYRRGSTSFMSNYINPNAIQVMARAIGVRSDEPITVDQMRLEVLRRTGRQRWRLAGTQGGEPWRATINPNGTNFRLVPVKKGA